MYTIVVADDEEDLRRTIIRKIDWESIGFQVVGEAENGVEALELVTKNEPDLLLTGYPHAVHIGAGAGEAGAGGASVHADRIFKRI